MTTHTLTCVACESTFTVDESQETSRCVSCGTEYAGPWGDPDVLSSPLLSADEIEQANASAADSAPPDTASAETVQTRGEGVTIRITIEVIPG